MRVDEIRADDMHIALDADDMHIVMDADNMHIAMDADDMPIALDVVNTPIALDDEIKGVMARKYPCAKMQKWMMLRL